MAEKAQPRPVNIEFQVDDDVAQGIYSNLAMVNHNENEFTIDFFYVQPQPPRARLRSRIILSARHTKRILAALSENIARYEGRFGVIDVTPTQGGEPEYH